VNTSTGLRLSREQPLAIVRRLQVAQTIDKSSVAPFLKRFVRWNQPQNVMYDLVRQWIAAMAQRTRRHYASAYVKFRNCVLRCQMDRIGAPLCRFNAVRP
jgi:hypothetical protein